MVRSSFAAKGLTVGLLVLGGVAGLACGGDKPPPKPPETPTASEDAGAESTMAGGDTDGGGAGAAHAEGAGGDKPAAAAALPLPAAAAKLKVKVKKEIDVEIKSDGTVHHGGKPAGKISGMELQDKDGKTQLKVDADGTITTGEGAAYAKFEGDDLSTLTGAKYSIADDGAVSSTDDKGKKAALGKSEGVGAAKRTALLAVAFSMWGTKAPAPKGEAKKGDKAEGKKPAGKK
jgi:hypothetical protein